MENLLTYFQSTGFPEDASTKIASAFKPKELQKGDFFVMADKVSKMLAFLESGQLQSYSIDSNGDERTTYISLPNTFVASLLSFHVRRITTLIAAFLRRIITIFTASNN